MGFALQRFVPSGRRNTSRRSLPLLASLSTAARGGCPSPVRAALPRASGPAPKSRSVGPRECAVGVERAFRGFSPTRKSVLRSAVIGRTNGADPLLGFSVLQGVPPTRLDATVAASPLTHFRLRVPKQADDRCLRVSIGGTMGWSLSRLPTLLDSLSSSRGPLVAGGGARALTPVRTVRVSDAMSSL